MSLLAQSCLPGTGWSSIIVTVGPQWQSSYYFLNRSCILFKLLQNQYPALNHVIHCDLWRHRYGAWRHTFCSGTDTAWPDVTTTVVPAADVINPDRKRRPVTPEVTLTDVFFLNISGVSEFGFACHPCAGAMFTCFIFAFFRVFWASITGVEYMWPFVGYASSLIRRQIQNWQKILDRRRDALGLLNSRHGSAHNIKIDNLLRYDQNFIFKKND